MQNRAPASFAATLSVVLLAAAVLHLPALRAPFFANDFLFLDHAASHSLVASLTGPDPVGDYYRPFARQIWFEVIGRLGTSGPLVAHGVNLLLALLSIGMVWLITRRLAGPIAATAAAWVFAFHQAFDVPLLWASGSQDLFALAGALAAILLFMERQPRAAAVALFVALLSKESVAAAIIVAIVAGHAPNERWSATFRRAQPLLVAFVGWSALWISAWVRGMFHPGASLHPSVPNLVAAFTQFGRVALGLEWRPGFNRTLPDHLAALWPIGIVLIVAMLTLRWDPWSRAPRVPGARRAAPIALLWACGGILPVAAVAPVWSAYFYLFALAGFAVFAGVVCARVSRPVGVAIAVALVCGSTVSRELDAFAMRPDPWAVRSHVNRTYVLRSSAQVRLGIEELKLQRPGVDHRTTFFFAELPPELAGLQAGDGPLVRWIYADTSLRSYLLADLTAERARRGPALFFAADRRGVHEVESNADLRGLAVGLAEADRLEPARDAFALVLERYPEDSQSRTWLAWTSLALGDSATAIENLKQLGYKFGMRAPGFDPALEPAPLPPGIDPADIAQPVRYDSTGQAEPAPPRRRVKGGGFQADSLRMIRDLARETQSAPFDARRHARIADLALAQPEYFETAAVEAFAARVLAPDAPASWRRWGSVLQIAGRLEMAVSALEKALALSGGSDSSIQQAVDEIRRLMREEPLAAREP